MGLRMSLEICPQPAEGTRAARPRRSLTETILPAGVRFVSDVEREELCARAVASRCIVLRPRADRFGALARAIDGDLESALAIRGALPPPVSSDARVLESLDDQLRRARMLPARGICLALPRLAAVTDADLVLSGEDGRYLSAFLRAAWSRESAMPVLVLIAELDRHIALPVPRTLEEIVGEEIERIDEECARHFAESERVIESISEAKREADGLTIPDLLALSEAERASSESEDEIASASESATESETAAASESAAETASADASESEIETETVSAKVSETVIEVEAATAAETKTVSVVVTETLRPAVSEPAAPVVVAAEDDEAKRAERLLHMAAHRAHAVELDAARGPKPVSTIERLYAQHYVPLIGGMHRGECDASVKEIAHDWSRSFAESYTEAFANIRVTGKRPTMVFDAFEVASRIARLSSARQVKLVLIDSMSFDLAERVASRMKVELDKRAVLVERTTLWSSLPSSTPTQMQLLARGAEGLREPPVSASEPDVSRGRSITTMRRERLGNRELMKLDLVEARLHSPGASYDERLDALADEATDLIVMFMETLPPRTLLYVFGDHGFLLGPGSNGWATGPAIQGGASPDEILVSGHAWLVDAMQ